MAYSPIRHLAWSLWLNHDPARVHLGVFVEIAGYYDASGSESDVDGAVVAIGLLSTEKKWLRFEIQWQQALKIIDAPRLHMTHFVADAEIYKHLRDREEDKLKFLAAAIKAIKVNINKVVVAIVHVRAFREASAIYILDDTLAGEYTVAGGSCLMQAQEWLDKKHPGSPVRHVFEQGDTGQKKFLELAARAGFSPIPQKKIDPKTGLWFAPFQAADLIAWELRNKELEHIGERAPQGQRPSFGWITKHLSNAAFIYDKQGLIRTFEENPERYPKRT